MMSNDMLYWYYITLILLAFTISSIKSFCSSSFEMSKTAVFQLSQLTRCQMKSANFAILQMAEIS